MDSPLVRIATMWKRTRLAICKDIAGENDERPAECGRTAPADGRVCVRPGDDFQDGVSKINRIVRMRCEQ